MSSATAVRATSVGAYKLIRKIGEGGMGEVWEAEHGMIGRRAAIKFLLPSFTSNPSTVERFFNEARAVAVVADPGIIQIYDYGSEDGQAYIVMELLAGEELSTRLRRIGRMSALDVVRLAKQIAASLASVHEKGVIHRDLKPDNVFLVGDPAVTGGERTKLLDFGIAKLTQHDSQFKTQTGQMMGTPAYMSPEQCRATPIDHRSDIYSLGVMMFVMITGRPPFDGEGSGDVVIAHVRDPAPRPSSFHRGVPRELEAIIMRCLEKQPDARYASAAELLTALTRAESALTAVTGFEPTSEMQVTLDPARSSPPRSRRPWLIAVVALTLVGAGVAVVLGTRGGEVDAPRASSPQPPVAPEPTPAVAAPITEPATPPVDAAPVADEVPVRPKPRPVPPKPKPVKPTHPKPTPTTPTFDRGD